jgi:FixJ family two-component response regulator
VRAEALSEREIQVLSYCAEGLSDRQIAERLGDLVERERFQINEYRSTGE